MNPATTLVQPAVRAPEPWAHELLALAQELSRWPLGFLLYNNADGLQLEVSLGLSPAELEQAAALAREQLVRPHPEPRVGVPARGPLRAWATAPLARGGLLAVADRRERTLRPERLAALGRLAALPVVAAPPRPVGDAYHDLRNLLNAMTLNAALLARKVDPGNPALRRHVELLHRSAEEVSELSALLLEYSRLGGALRLERQPVALEALLADAEQLARPEAEAVGASLACRVEGELALHVDRSRLSRVLGYLVEARLADAGEGGQVELWARAENDGATFGCQAAGSGAPPADPATRTRLALALEVARGLVLAHGGSWQDCPRDGRLPEIEFRLPAAG